MPVLKTRLYKPTVNDNYIFRERIISLLEKSRKKPLTLIVAGAGYGKSIAVSQWLDRSEMKYCWISLEEDCNNLRQAMAYLVGAVHSVFPGSLAESTDMINAIDLPSARIITTTFINELSEIKQNLNIVLDDYHVISNEEIHTLIDDLMRHPPEWVKMTILTRHDPPLQLGSLFAGDQVCEIRMAELRFTPGEIIRLSNEVYEYNLSPELAETIFKTTEGWIIGTRLLLKGVIEGMDINESLMLLKENQGNLKDYLLGELLVNQSEFVRKGILIASLFDRFSVALIHRLMTTYVSSEDEDINSQMSDFEQIIKNAMFIIPLDNEQTWFRFHHLIREFLNKQIIHYYSENEINEFYKNASLYYESIQLPEESFQCALLSKDITLIIKIFTDYYPLFINTDQYTRLEKWMSLLPAGIIETNVEVLLINAFQYDSKNNYQAMAISLDKALEMLPPLDEQSDISRNLWSLYYAIQSSKDFYMGKLDSSIESSEKAEKLFISEISYMHDYAIAFKCMGLSMKGRTDLAIESLDNYQKQIHEDQLENLMRQNVIRTMVHAIQGQIHLIEGPSLLAGKISAEKGHWITNCMANYYLATMHYLQNNLDEVKPYLDSALEHRFLVRPYWVMNVYFTAGLTLLANNKYDELDHLLVTMHEYASKITYLSLNETIAVFEIEISLRKNDLTNAIKLADDTNFKDYPVIFFFYAPKLTLIKLMVYAGDLYSKQESQSDLEKFIEECRNLNINQLLLQAYALMSLVKINNGDMDNALYYLRESLKLSRGGGFIRTFLDLGEPMKTLFRELDPLEKQDPWVEKIMKAFNQEKLITGLSFSRDETKNLIMNESELTTREVEILQLIAKGHSNKEIAEMLYLSLGTVKTYIYNIYQKMGVRNRMTAISKSRDLLTATNYKTASKNN